MLIGGKSQVAGEWVSVPNPAHTSTIVGRYPSGTPAHVEQAVQAARDALPEWRSTSAQQRAALLLQAAATLGERLGEWTELLTAENGKVLGESHLDFAMAAGTLGSYGAHPDWMDDERIEDERRRLVIHKQPIGVCAAIIPWNFPLVLAALKIAPALLAGNTMIVKVPEFSPLATLQGLGAVAEIFPPGVLNLVSGFGPEVGRNLVQHRHIRKIAFTGSTETGRLVMADAAGHLARLTLELGGNDAAIVLEDAKLDQEMIKRIVTATYAHTGQICMAIKRLYVHRSRYDELVDALRDEVNQIVVGDGIRPEVTMGPINNERQFQKVSRILAETEKDCNVIQLGSYADGTRPDEGYFMLPRLVLEPADASPIVACEQMGPILPIMSFDDEDDAISRANDSEYGLTSSIWSADRDRAFAVGQRVEAGITFINGHSLYAFDTEAPAGGAKQSGFGYENTARGLDGYVQLHSITDNYLTL
jgi:acyl-CoA reductase-like NAD-dependent aldehyde dehydrogenase